MNELVRLNFSAVEHLAVHEFNQAVLPIIGKNSSFFS
jgi:hypothetical protein